MHRNYVSIDKRGISNALKGFSKVNVKVYLLKGLKDQALNKKRSKKNPIKCIKNSHAKERKRGKKRIFKIPLERR